MIKINGKTNIFKDSYNTIPIKSEDVNKLLMNLFIA